jgi:hypothetical protein
MSAKPDPYSDAVARLVADGAPEDLAREVCANNAREKLVAQHIVTAGAFEMADTMPDVSYVMAPVLVQRQVITLTGRAGHGKSTVAIAIAFALALQRELGPLKPAREGLVYFVSAEDMDGTRKRIYAEGVRHRLTEDQRKALDRRLRWVHVNVTMNPALIAEHIRGDSRDQDIAAIFVDTGLALFAGDDDNANMAMQAFAVSCRAFTELNGAPSVVVFWHPVKNAGADNLAPRGGSALLNAIDGNLTLWLDTDTDTATLSHSKWRADVFEPIDFALEKVKLILPTDAYATTKIATPKSAADVERDESKGAERREQLLVTLADARGPVSQRELGAAAGATKSTVGRDLLHMTSCKPALVAVDPVTGHYTLTATGRRAAEAARERDARAYRAQSEGE